MINIRILIISTCISLANPFIACAEEMVTLKTRAGVSQRFILIKPDKPKASVILFAGGHGKLNLPESFNDQEIPWGKNNFLVRSRNIFARQGLMVAVVDAPSDIKSDSYRNGMKGGFRTTAEHFTDIDHVIRYLRKQAKIPIWLVGTSRGTESAAYIAYNSKQRPDGVVLTASMSVANKNGEAVTEMALQKITIPAYVAAHEEDDCFVTPPHGAREIFNMLINSKRKVLKMFTGGDELISGACNAKSHHGFLGLEEKVVKDISKFILDI